MACLGYNSSKIQFKQQEYTRAELLRIRGDLCGTKNEIDLVEIERILNARSGSYIEKYNTLDRDHHFVIDIND